MVLDELMNRNHCPNLAEMDLRTKSLQRPTPQCQQGAYGLQRKLDGIISRYLNENIILKYVFLFSLNTCCRQRGACTMFDGKILHNIMSQDMSDHHCRFVSQWLYLWDPHLRRTDIPFSPEASAMASEAATAVDRDQTGGHLTLLASYLERISYLLPKTQLRGFVFPALREWSFKFHETMWGLICQATSDPKLQELIVKGEELIQRGQEHQWRPLRFTVVDMHILKSCLFPLFESFLPNMFWCYSPRIQEFY